MILKDYEETCNPFLFLEPLHQQLYYFIIILFNPVNNHGSKKGLSYDSPASQLVLVADL